MHQTFGIANGDAFSITRPGRVQQRGEDIAVNVRQIAGDNQIQLAAPACERRFNPRKWAKTWPLVFQALKRKIAISRSGAYDCNVVNDAGRLARDSQDQRITFEGKQRLISTHARTVSAREHEAGRLHAKIVALVWRISGYNRKNKLGLFCLMSFCAWSSMPLSGKTGPLAETEHGRNAFMVSVVRTDAAGRFVRLTLPAKQRVKTAAPRRADTSKERIAGLVEETSRRYGVDPLLVESLIHVESNANPAVTSPKGAQGLMQLIPDTARRFGVSDAFDPKDNIEGGVRYLKYLQTLFPNDATLSIAAYNSGENAVAKYKTVPPYAETLAYVQKVSRQYARLTSQASAANTRNNFAGQNLSDARHVEETIDSEGRLYLRTR